MAHRRSRPPIRGRLQTECERLDQWVDTFDLIEAVIPGVIIPPNLSYIYRVR
jgi:hypothetical protein